MSEIHYVTETKVSIKWKELGLSKEETKSLMAELHDLIAKYTDGSYQLEIKPI